MPTRPAVVFGDVHGESKLLEMLIAKVRGRFGDEVDIYSTGDLIDRGPDSKGVLDICIREGVQAILGNHELWFHQLCAQGVFQEMALHPSMKGDRTLLSYGVTKFNNRMTSAIADEALEAIPQEHKDYILSLPITRKFDVGDTTYRLIHAGLKKADARAFLSDARKHAQDNGESVDDMLVAVAEAVQPAVLMWTSPSIRGKHAKPNLHKFDDGSVQVFGHIPIREPMVTRRWIALDTGCGTCPPHRLSAVILPDREVISVGEMDDRINSDGFSDFSMG